jgi:hypothetical protein
MRMVASLDSWARRPRWSSNTPVAIRGDNKRLRSRLHNLQQHWRQRPTNLQLPTSSTLRLTFSWANCQTDPCTTTYACTSKTERVDLSSPRKLWDASKSTIWGSYPSIPGAGELTICKNENGATIWEKWKWKRCCFCTHAKEMIQGSTTAARSNLAQMLLATNTN